MRRRVAILGTGPSVVRAPWGDPTWEKWALNGLARTGWDNEVAARGFEIHPWSILSTRTRRACRTTTFPVYMRRKYAAVPRAVRYPIERVREGGPLTCTFCFEIALALSEGVREIGLWGVDLPLGTARERTVEWWGVAFWLGRALGAGVRVRLPKGSQLLAYPHHYGLDYWQEVRAVRQRLRGLGDELMSGKWDGFGGEFAEVSPRALRELTHH